MTIVCFERKFIFIKAKKVASTSVEAFLRRWAMKEDIVTPLTPRDEKWCADRGWISKNYSNDPMAEKEYVDLCKKGLFDDAAIFLKSFKKIYAKHMPTSQLKIVLERKGYVWSDFFSFSVDRDPYSWLLSVLLYDNNAYHRRGDQNLDLKDINERALALLDSDNFAERLNS